MTTTIIIEEILTMTLLIVFFNMKDVCFVNIHPPFGKKNCGKQKIMSEPGFSGLKMDDEDISNLPIFLIIPCNHINHGTI